MPRRIERLQRCCSDLDRLRAWTECVRQYETVQATEDSRCANQTAGREREFSVNDKVFARFWYGTKRWWAGVILRRSGDATYDVQIGDQLHRWHSTQLLRDVNHTGDTPESEATRESDQPVDEQTEPAVIAVAPPLNIMRPNITSFAVPSDGTVQPSTLTRSTVVPKAVPESERSALEPIQITQDAPDAPRRSNREHRAPKSFDEEFSGRGSVKA